METSTVTEYFRWLDDDGKPRGLIRRRRERSPLWLETIEEGGWVFDAHVLRWWTGIGGDCYDFVEISEDEARELAALKGAEL